MRRLSTSGLEENGFPAAGVPSLLMRMIAPSSPASVAVGADVLRAQRAALVDGIVLLGRGAQGSPPNCP